MKYAITTTALILALAMPATAGGPVLTEDSYEAEAPREDRKIGGLVVGLIAIAAIIALAGGSDTCTTEEPVEPEQPRGGC